MKKQLFAGMMALLLLMLAACGPLSGPEDVTTSYEPENTSEPTEETSAPEEDTTPGVKRYFKLLGRRFWKLISLNLMMLPMILPILLIAYFYLGMDKTPTQSYAIFPQLFGANLIESR